jgi:hypothetical protein
VADFRLSQPRPILRCTQPKPLPSVKPAIRLPLLLTLAFLALTAPLIHPGRRLGADVATTSGNCDLLGSMPGIKKGSGAKFNYVDLPDLHSLDLVKGQLAPDRSTPGLRDHPNRKRPLAQGSSPPLIWRSLLFWRYPMTAGSTALCSSERILASFKGSRLTPERNATSSDLGSRIHSVPRSSRCQGAQPESSSSSSSSASAAVP